MVTIQLEQVMRDVSSVSLAGSGKIGSATAAEHVMLSGSFNGGFLLSVLFLTLVPTYLSYA